MRLFTDVLRDHRGGKLVDHLTRQLADVVNAVIDTDKPGTINLTLKIVPAKGEDLTFEVIPNVAVKLPQHDLPKSIFYADEDNSLVREPPKGGALFQQDEIESARERRRGGDRD